MLDDIEAVKIEQDRHMHLLHSNVTGLRTNLDVINKVAATKVHNHLADNQNLLKEVNNLRSEVIFSIFQLSFCLIKSGFRYERCHLTISDCKHSSTLYSADRLVNTTCIIHTTVLSNTLPPRNINNSRIRTVHSAHPLTARAPAKTVWTRTTETLLN